MVVIEEVEDDPPDESPAVSRQAAQREAARRSAAAGRARADETGAASASPSRSAAPAKESSPPPRSAPQASPSQTRASSAPSEQSGTAAFSVSGAGAEDANGLYRPTGKDWHGAPVYENDRRCLISREPHRNNKTMETRYGWILGQDKKPLYAVQSESMVPPKTGWKKFQGAAPAPAVEGHDSVAGAAAATGVHWKDAGNTQFAARRYEDAEAHWTRALDISIYIEDKQLKAALYANRAEVYLRQKQWQNALEDAQNAFGIKPDHEKALLRGAVAARELKRFPLAIDLVRRCICFNPRHPEAGPLLAELEQQAEREANEKPSKAKQSASAKWMEAVKSSEPINSLEEAKIAKDENLKKGVKAFGGYSDQREKSEKLPKPGERVPLNQLPYHQMGLPQDQIELMDKFFQENREKQDKEAREKKEKEEAYQKVKAEYRQNAGLNADGSIPEGWEDPDLPEGCRSNVYVHKPEEHQPEEPTAAAQAADAYKKGTDSEVKSKKEADAHGWARTLEQRKKKAQRERLAKTEADEIDSLFASLTLKNPPVPPRPLETKSSAGLSTNEERRVLEERRAQTADKENHVQTTNAVPDRRTPLERQLDNEEAMERRRKEHETLQALHDLRRTARGEPTRLEQAGLEVYAWWALPPSIKKSDIKLEVKKGGDWLTLQIGSVVVFDRQLQERVKADDVIWSIEDNELHLTLTKHDKKIWEELGAMAEVEYDENGVARPETLPEPQGPGERLAKFKELIEGDDGTYSSYDELGREGKHMVDVMRRFQHGRATGDKKEMYEAQVEMEEMGRMVI